jgi:hypothetical protein
LTAAGKGGDGKIRWDEHRKSYVLLSPNQEFVAEVGRTTGQRFWMEGGMFGVSIDSNHGHMLQSIARQFGVQLQQDKSPGPNNPSNKVRNTVQVGPHVQRMMDMDNPHGALPAAFNLAREELKYNWEKFKAHNKEKREQNRFVQKEKGRFFDGVEESLGLSPMEAKPMEMGKLEQILQKCPILQQLFTDPDELEDFVESMNDGELRIILSKPNDASAIALIRERVRTDVEKSCKALEIDG